LLVLNHINIRSSILTIHTQMFYLSASSHPSK